MDPTPLVSVVLPCYNGADFIADAIDSVRAQTYPAVELIVVDDGSTDASGEIAAAYHEVTLVRQPRGGLSAARNAGLRTAAAHSARRSGSPAHIRTASAGTAVRGSGPA